MLGHHSAVRESERKMNSYSEIRRERCLASFRGLGRIAVVGREICLSIIGGLRTDCCTRVVLASKRMQKAGTVVSAFSPQSEGHRVGRPDRSPTETQNHKVSSPPPGVW